MRHQELRPDGLLCPAPSGEAARPALVPPWVFAQALPHPLHMVPRGLPVTCSGTECASPQDGGRWVPSWHGEEEMPL